MKAKKASRPQGPAPRRPASAGAPTRPAGSPAKPARSPALGTRVFVYGSLLSGERNHHFLARSQHIGEARTRPMYTLFDLGAYPALVAEGTTSITGEIYEVDEATLAELDRLEGHPRLYQRTPIILANNTPVVTYLMDAARVEGCTPITSGSWRTRQAERRAAVR